MATKSKKILTKKNALKNPVLMFQPLINWKRLVGRTLMACGASMIVITIFLTQMAYISPDKQTIVLSKEITNSIYPISLEFNHTFFHLKTDNFKYGLWPLSDDSPVYLESSGVPGQPGNIIIYGHNTPKIFANLHAVKEGSVVTLTTNEHETFYYKIDSIKKVFPQNVEILQQGREEQLTLFTCTGLFDSMRLVVSGKRT